MLLVLNDKEHDQLHDKSTLVIALVIYAVNKFGKSHICVKAT